ncbi:MAG TPA: S1C family serine protease [Planctomycetaceae bacterium]|nr:S1C family serine protease [Planctomycetaceae bacterium]
MKPTHVIPWLAACWLCLSTPVWSQSTGDAIAAVAPKMVKLFGAGGRKNLYGYGSGCLISPNGHIATVWSHLLDADTVTVVLDDGRRFSGKVLGAEPALDLAVLKIDAEDLPHFDLTKETATAGPGARVLAFSNVFKVATGDEPVTVMHGVISAVTTLSARRGVFDAPYSGPVYVVDAVTNNSGAAGGVLTTRDGRLLGLLGKELKNNATHTWLNYVVPIGQLRTPMEEIVTGQFKPTNAADRTATPTAPQYVPADFGIVVVPNVVDRTPAYIDAVQPGSPARQAGLLPDDLIVFVGDRLIPSCRVLEEEFGRLEPGDTLRLVVRRGEKLQTFELPVPRKPTRGD